MRVRNLTKRFTSSAILPLARKFLKQFVRNHESSVMAIHVCARMVCRRPFAVQNSRKTTTASPVRVILLNRRIQIPSRLQHVAVHRYRGSGVSVVKRQKARSIIETAALKRCRSVQSRMDILVARRLDDAAQFQAEFGGIGSRTDVQ